MRDNSDKDQLLDDEEYELPVDLQSVESYKPADGSQKTAEVVPLPYKKMAVVGLMQLTESLALSQVTPYAPFMVQDFLGVPDDDPSVGIYTGIMDAVFPFAQFLTSYHWGNLSDKIGRRPCLLAGMIGTVCTLTVFGFSVTLPMAIGVRFCVGFFNGNNGILKSYLAEILHESNTGKGFSYYIFVHSIGIVIGPFIGGQLARPADKYPTWFADTLFETFPYLLPCLVCAILSVFGIIFGFMYMEETVKFDKKDMEINTDELEPSAGSRSFFRRFRCRPLTPGAVLESLVKNLKYMICLALYAGTTSVAFAWMTVFPLWAKIPPEDNGYGWDTDDIGMVQAAGGVGMFIMQLWLYPWLCDHWTQLTLFRAVLYVPTLQLFAFPLMGMIVAYEYQIGGFIVWNIFFMALFTASITCVYVLLRNSVTANILGSAYGFAQSTVGLLRSAGPILGGVLFSVSYDGDTNGGIRNIPLLNRNMMLYVIGLIFLVMIAISYKLPESINSPVDSDVRKKSIDYVRTSDDLGLREVNRRRSVNSNSTAGSKRTR